MKNSYRFPNHHDDCPSTVSRYADYCAYCSSEDELAAIDSFIAEARELGTDGEVRFRSDMGGTFVLYRYNPDSPTRVSSVSMIKMSKVSSHALDVAGLRTHASQTL